MALPWNLYNQNSTQILPWHYPGTFTTRILHKSYRGTTLEPLQPELYANPTVALPCTNPTMALPWSLYISLSLL